MKHFLRIAITLIVLVAVGFSCYYFFFKPDSDLETFTKLSDTIDKREKLGVDAKLNNLYNFNGHGTKNVSYHKVQEHMVEVKDENGKNPTKVNSTIGADIVIGTNGYDYVQKNASTPSEKETYFGFDNSGKYVDILKYRDYMFKGGISSNNIGANNKIEVSTGVGVYSYVVVEKSLDAIFDYYFAYAQVLDGVKNSDQKAMNKEIKEYNSALTAFNTQLQNVYNYQKAFNFNAKEGEENVFEITTGPVTEGEKTYFIVKQYTEYDTDTNTSGKMELTSRYLELIKRYRELLTKKSEMIESLKDMVIKYVFGGEYIIETNTVKMDLTLMSVKSAVSGEYDIDKSISKLRNATQFIDISMGLEQFKDGSSADDVLEQYSKIVKNAKSDLVLVLNLNNAELNYFADNSDSVKDITSKLNQDYVSDIQSLLKAYGFGLGL